MSLRAFRFQKAKKSENLTSDGAPVATSSTNLDLVEENGSHHNSFAADDSSQDSPIKFNPVKKAQTYYFILVRSRVTSQCQKALKSVLSEVPKCFFIFYATDT